MDNASYLLNTFYAFVALFVAMDVAGALPVFIALTEGMDGGQKKRVMRQSIVTSLAVGIGFLAVGKFVFSVLGIKVSDFKIAGGILLLVFAVKDLTMEGGARKYPSATLGVVPIGMPLILGPAALTTLLILVETYKIVPTIASFVANLCIVWLTFSQSARVIRAVGEPGAKAFAKVASLLLAAIAVMMIRRGLVELIRELNP
jgi:multiple antibiotic resistance protein